MNICIGIISYLPENLNKRENRIKKLSKLIESCNYLFNLDILIIAQNWTQEDIDLISSLNTSIKLELFKDKLGIVGARKELRRVFLDSNYDYLIMLDDDCELTGTKEAGQAYIEQIKNHPNMCGKFSGTLLKLFAISKFLFSQVNYGDGKVEDGDFFEDILLVNTIDKKFPDKVFTFLKTGLNQKSNNFNDENSTWFWGQFNKREIGDRTRALLKKF